MISVTPPPITNRPLRGDDDFWRVRRLLIETYPITPTGFNWDIRHWDGSRFHNVRDDWDERGLLQVWETAAGQPVGVAHCEGRSEFFLQIHPDYRFLEEEMVVWAETHLALPGPDGAPQIETFVFDYDTPRRRLLARGGYQPTDETGVTRRMRLGSRSLPQPVCAEGYTFRCTRPSDESEYGQIAALLNAAFQRTFHCAEEYKRFVMTAPCFRHDLNLVAEAPDGSFAAHVGITYDEANRRGIYEPVCTHPDHRRHGLASGLMLLGLQRLKALGAADVYVETGSSVAANELYDSVGFSEAYTGRTWRKTLPAGAVV